jgi:hypothetical protein
MERRSAVFETVAAGGLDDAAGGGEQADALVESGGPDPTSGAQIGERKRLSGFGERRRDALVERGRGNCDGLGPLDHLQGEGRAILGQLDDERAGRWSRAMLDGQRQLLAVATQIEVAVAPGVELGGAAQGLAGADASSALPGVVHDEHGDAAPTLQLAQLSVSSFFDGLSRTPFDGLFVG